MMDAPSEQPPMMTWTKYDELYIQLLNLLMGDLLESPSGNAEERIIIAVCDANGSAGMTPGYWATLDKLSREPWLEKTIRALAKGSQIRTTVDWNEYRDERRADGKLLSPKFCRGRYRVFGKELTLAAQKDPSVRQKNPAGAGYVYRYDVVRDISERKSRDDD